MITIRLPLAWHNLGDNTICRTNKPLLYYEYLLDDFMPLSMIHYAYRLILDVSSPQELENKLILSGAYKRTSRILTCRKDSYTACLWLEVGKNYGACIIYSRRIRNSGYVRYILNREACYDAD